MLRTFLFLLLSTTAVAADFSGKDSMNGISYSDYEDFPAKWELVTIRFRKDTGEMRLTYGNALAMKTLKSGSTDYPDGAVFAKTGVHTSKDPQFESSVVPRGIRRYQLMVKNKKLYSTTGGWGYGLFDAKGKTFAEDPKVTQDACYACHTIVENRGDVFSGPFDFIKDTKFPSHKASVLGEKLRFNWVAVKTLPQNIGSFLGTFTKARMLVHEKISKKVFQGTLDELKPILEDEARKEKGPAFFRSDDSKRFVIVLPKKSESCMGEGSFEVISTDLELKPITETYCTHD